MADFSDANSLCKDIINDLRLFISLPRLMQAEQFHVNPYLAILRASAAGIYLRENAISSVDISAIYYLPSKSFSEVTVNENLLISNSSFGTIKSGAFLIYNPNRIEVTVSKFDVLEGGAFRINSTSFDLKLVNVCAKWSCDCDTISSAFENIDQIEELNCLPDDTYTNYQEFRNTSCILFASNATVIIAICVTLILLLILGMALWCFFKKAYRCDKYGGEKDKKKKLSIIVPDGRTYRETELHV
ncbi:hypothetical protein Trydic_g19940, partial [Trypoxylus dichotomus]